MDYELISAEEFDSLPEDDEQCFVEFEAICRRNMTRMINSDTSGNFDRSVQAQYMAAVSSVAVECGFTHLLQPSTIESDNNFYENFSRFSLTVQGEVARIRIRGRRSRGSLSVQLTDNTRARIQHYVTRLGEVIDASDLPAARKATMHGRLRELVEELEKRRLNLGKTMFVLSMVVANLAGTTHIMRLIGVDKMSEEKALSRLASPPKALPAPSQTSIPTQKRVVPSWETTSSDLDDEIPF